MNPPATLASSAHRLLTDFVALPVGMFPAQHLSLIRHLHGVAQGAQVPPTNGASYIQWAMDGYKGEPWKSPLYSVDPTTGVALLKIEGALAKGYDDATCFIYGLASIDRISREVAELSARSDVRCLVIHLNTPGGQSTGMPELAQQIATLSARIPVITHTSDMACSNGMRLAVAGTQFYPAPSAMVGCIGTYIAMYNQTKMLEEWGIKLELYRAGKYKAIGLPGKDTAEDEAAFIQASVDRSNGIFKAFVLERRPHAEVNAMEGQWFDGAEAVAYHLADATVSTLDEVLALAASL
jgi:signal peptide peptidase SppA